MFQTSKKVVLRYKSAKQYAMDAKKENPVFVEQMVETTLNLAKAAKPSKLLSERDINRNISYWHEVAAYIKKAK